MLTLAATIRAVDLHGDLLRIAVAGASNDHRLGANEAPPAIMSVYLGAALTKSVARFIAGDKSTGPSAGEKDSDFNVDLKVPYMPAMSRDTGDRNRTSPFAFTGNRFEFRAVGSSQNPSRSCMIINTIVADSLSIMADEITKAGGGPAAAEKVARETLKKHQRICFEGDGYSAEWRAEAKRRGIPELRTTGQSLNQMLSAKNIELFSRLGVLSPEEQKMRFNAFSEDYIKRVEIEADTLAHMVEGSIVLVASKHAAVLADAATSGVQKDHALRVSNFLDKLILATKTLNELTAALHDEKDVFDFMESKILPQMLEVRSAADELEDLIPPELWPFPSYAQLLHGDPHM